MNIPIVNSDDSLQNLLLYAGFLIPIADVGQWTASARRECFDWAGAQYMTTCGVKGITVPQIPNILRAYGKPCTLSPRTDPMEIPHAHCDPPLDPSICKCGGRIPLPPAIPA